MNQFLAGTHAAFSVLEKQAALVATTGSASGHMIRTNQYDKKFIFIGNPKKTAVCYINKPDSKQMLSDPNPYKENTMKTQNAPLISIDIVPAGTFNGPDMVPPGTFHGGDKVPDGTFHGGDKVPDGTFHCQ